MVPIAVAKQAKAARAAAAANSMRILLSGSSGFIGSALSRVLKQKGHEIVPLVRTSVRFPSVQWDPASGDFSKEAFEGFDAVIHLAGKNIASGLWTKKCKKALFLSRCRDSWLLSQVLTRLYQPPKVVLCASAIGFYGDRGTEMLTEESPKGEGFLPDLCEHWEASMQSIENRGARVVRARFGPVLYPDGGMMGQLRRLCKLRLLGKWGSGAQIISWVALEDAVGALCHALTHDAIEGPLNVVAPNPVSQEAFARILCRREGVSMGLPLPTWLIRSALREMGEALLLSSACVKPKKLLDTGYVFQYPTLETRT